MASNTTEIITGGAVFAVAMGFLVYAGGSVGAGMSSASYPVTASFRSIEGVSVGTDVRLAGVKIGTVSGVGLNPETFYADATIAIRDGIVLPEDSAAVIASEGLLGGNFVEILPGGALENLEPGGEIIDTQGSVSLISLLLRFVSGGGGDETGG